MDILDDVLEFLGTIPNINLGGCGIAAISVLRWAEKYSPESRKEITPVFCYHEDEPKTCESNMVNSIAGNANGVSTPSHIGIMYKGSILESGGEEVDTENYPLFHEVSVEILEACLSNYWTWNCFFSRFQSIPLIESALGISLQDMLIVNLQKTNQFLKEKI
jgi:hypothetical protein